MSDEFHVRDEFESESESEEEDIEENFDDNDEDVELSDTGEEDKEEGRTSDVKNSNTQSVIEDLTNVEVDSSENVQNLVTENNNKLKLSWNGEELFPGL